MDDNKKLTILGNNNVVIIISKIIIIFILLLVRCFIIKYIYISDLLLLVRQTKLKDCALYYKLG